MTRLAKLRDVTKEGRNRNSEKFSLCDTPSLQNTNTGLGRVCVVRPLTARHGVCRTVELSPEGKKGGRAHIESAWHGPALSSPLHFRVGETEGFLFNVVCLKALNQERASSHTFKGRAQSSPCACLPNTSRGRRGQAVGMPIVQIGYPSEVTTESLGLRFLRGRGRRNQATG